MLKLPKACGVVVGNSDGKLRDDRGDRDDRDRPDRTLLYPGDRDDRVKFTCDPMETVNRPDRLHTISSDRGHWGDRGDYMETRLKDSCMQTFDVIVVLSLLGLGELCCKKWHIMLLPGL